MYVTKNENNQPGLGHALAHFIESNNLPDVKENLFTLLHYALASVNADHLSAFERDSLFYTVKQLQALIDVMYAAQEGIDDKGLMIKEKGGKNG